MYVVRDKKTKTVLHLNPAPLYQGLEGKAVYHKFDARSMEIGKTEATELPEHFNINSAGEIIELTLQEKVAAGIFMLASHQKVEEDRIVPKTIEELLEKGLLTLEEIKSRKLAHYEELAFTLRRSFLPDYKLTNAALGVYDEQTLAAYKATVQAFRKEFYRLKQLLERAKTMKALEAVIENYPRALVQVDESSPTTKKS